MLLYPSIRVLNRNPPVWLPAGQYKLTPLRSCVARAGQHQPVLTCKHPALSKDRGLVSQPALPASGPSEALRRSVAGNILTLLDGGHLSDLHWVRSLAVCGAYAYHEEDATLS